MGKLSSSELGRGKYIIKRGSQLAGATAIHTIHIMFDFHQCLVVDIANSRYLTMVSSILLPGIHSDVLQVVLVPTRKFLTLRVEGSRCHRLYRDCLGGWRRACIVCVLPLGPFRHEYRTLGYCDNTAIFGHGASSCFIWFATKAHLLG